MGGVDMGSNNKDTLVSLWKILNGNTKGSKKLSYRFIIKSPKLKNGKFIMVKERLIWSEIYF